jgi:hypothetical protein
MEANDSELAAVPLKTRYTSQWVSKMSRIKSAARVVSYRSITDFVALIGSTIAAKASGQMPP